jgi:SAM-dependent methyltransferase
MSNVWGVSGQSVSAQVLDAYFTVLTRQHQVNAAISSALQQISPKLQQDYQQLLQLKDEDGTLSWAYFRKNLERAGAGESLMALCRESRQLHSMVRRYHNLRLVDAYAQTTIDTSQSIRRLSFFDLQEGDKVAEIGFGYGYNLHLLALGHQHTSIYANELDAYRLKRMEQTLAEEYPPARNQQFHFINGGPASTKLENQELDLIIMENVFHHLLDQPTFLQSMLNSLGERGEIVIIEEFLDSGREGSSCKDLMAREQLIILFEKMGLKVLREAPLERQYKTMLCFGRDRMKGMDK